MSKCRYIRTSLSPLNRRVTIRKFPWKGYGIFRDGKEALTDAPILDKEDAEDFARKYCDYWGDEFGGFEE